MPSRTKALLLSNMALLAAACTSDEPCMTRGASHDLACECPPDTKYMRDESGSSWCASEDAGSEDSSTQRARGDQKPDAARSGATDLDSAVSQSDADRGAGDSNTSQQTVSDTGIVDIIETYDAGGEIHDAGSESRDAGVASRDAGQDAPDAKSACTPETEKCDTHDNDCDGEIDEGVTNACGTCNKLSHKVGDACDNGGQGPCSKSGMYVCFNGDVVCNAPSANPQQEDCDGVDDDCDGTPDDGLLNVCGGSMCGADLHLKGTPCFAGEDDCQGNGTWECDGPAANTLKCNAVAKQPNLCGTGCGPVPAEVCDGADNDCDNQTDEGFTKNACGGCLPLSGSLNALCLVERSSCAVTGRSACSGTDAIACTSSDVCATSTPAQARLQRNGFNCAIYGDGVVQCWGKNDYGQLGNGTRIDSALPVKVLLPAKATQWGNGSETASFACVELASPEFVHCWGLGFYPSSPGYWSAIPKRGALPGGPQTLDDPP